MARLFGTDGVRGVANEPPLTPEEACRLGRAAAAYLAERTASGRRRPALLVTRDTRVSGPLLEGALVAGILSAGVDALLAGVLPTPAAALLIPATGAAGGAVLSASHNPFADNGVKLFSSEGDKLPDATEQEIEARLADPIVTAPSAQLGKARRLNDAAGRYIEFCKSTFPTDLDLRGMKLVVDCAHGASYHIAPHVFHELGADVTAIGNQPDGLNINLDCGALHPRIKRQQGAENNPRRFPAPAAAAAMEQRCPNPPGPHPAVPTIASAPVEWRRR